MEFIFGIIVLVLDIWAIVSIIGSSASTGAKILWVLLILILPIVALAHRDRLSAGARPQVDPGARICYRSAAVSGMSPRQGCR